MPDDGFCVRSLAVTYRNGTALRAHQHAWGQLVYARAGVMRVQSSARIWLVPFTRALWLPAGVEHAIEMRGEVAMRTLYIAPALAQPLTTETAALAVSPLLQALVLHIIELGMLHANTPTQARLADLLIDLLSVARVQDLWLPLPRDKRALHVADHLQRCPDDRADLATLARTSNTSLRNLQRLFVAETGFALTAWRQRARLIHAAAALEGGAAVTTAALGCGFDSTSAFIAAFKRQFGVTPGRYGG